MFKASVQPKTLQPQTALSDVSRLQRLVPPFER
jgi:hypothetical protein